MKFQFAVEIAGMKKTNNEGTVKVFEGGKIDGQCEMEVNELLAILKNGQESASKLIDFFKNDIHTVIKNCGNEIINLERQNRIMNNELPSHSRKQMQEENNALHERIGRLEESLNDKEYQLDRAIRDCRGTSEALKELQEKYDGLQKKYDFLKKKYLEEDNEEEYTEPKSNKIF